MMFKKLLTNGEIILIATIALCTAISKNDTASTENYTASTENYSASTENDTDKMTNDTVVSSQLPYYKKQLHYDVKIKFNYTTNDIIGECNITIHIDHQIQNIFIEPGIFAIFKIVLYGNSSEKIHIPRYSFLYYSNMFMINFTNTPKLLPPGKYNLMMAYMRHINNNKEHFFKSSYSDKKLNNMLKATGIDVMTARQLFPIMCSTILCRDEANLNATFKISIRHHKNYTALSNILTKITENDEHDMMWTHFGKSSMSFNRIKVVITTFTNISTATANVTFWSRENTTYYLQLAECIAQQVLHFLKHENNIIKLPKLEYVAFWDRQHKSSDTEGLMLHRETDIIHNEIKDTISHKIQVSYLITYQIVSLWYADALLWSKTNFVTLLATYILNKIPSNHNVMNLFIVETQRDSFLYGTPSHIKEMNVLSYPLNYTKSSNIWRMLHHMIPDNVFWTGIRTYIDQQYNQTNAEITDDLWNIMQTVLHTYPDNSTVFIVKELISIWIAEKYYYPVLYVTRNPETKKTQFSYLIPDDIDEDGQYHPIFVTYTTKSIMNFQEIFNDKFFWLSPDKPEKRYEEFDENDWIIVNLQQTGYYRVIYDSNNWLKLALYMNSTEYINIHVLNRAQIIDDAFHSLIHKQLDYIMFWKISAFLSRDTNYVAWYPMLKIFEYLSLKVSIEDATDIRTHMEKILGGVLRQLGYKKQGPENDLTQCLREEVLKWACIFDNSFCMTVATGQLDHLLNSKNDTLIVIQPMRRRWMYCNGLKIASVNRWRFVWHQWESTSDDKYLEYLTCHNDPIVISTYLQMTTEREFLTRVPRNTRAYIILLIIAKHVKHDIVCNSLLKNLDTYILSFAFNEQTVKIAILIVVISHQHDVNQLEKVLEFAKADLKEMRLIDAVHKKIKKRRLEHGSQVRNYGLGLTLFT